MCFKLYLGGDRERENERKEFHWELKEAPNDKCKKQTDKKLDSQKTD